MNPPATVLVVLLSILVVGGSSTASFAHVGGPGTASRPPGELATDAVPLPVGAASHAMPATSSIVVTLTLANPNVAGLDRFLGAVENPTSPLFRHFLTFPEYVDDFAPPKERVAQVESVLSGDGATGVTVAPDRSSVTAVLSSTSVERMFGVRLFTFGASAGMPLYTAVGVPSLPTSLSGLVLGIGGLSDVASLHLADPSATLDVASRPVANAPGEFIYDPTSGENWYLGSDFAQAYGASDLLPGAHSVPNATYPTSVAIATLLASAYNDSEARNLPPWDPAVVNAYFNDTLGPGWPSPKLTGVPVTVASVTPPLPGSFGAVNDSTLLEAENSLDLEMAGSMAPGASIYNFYFAGSLLAGPTTVGDAADYLAVDLGEALSYDYAPAHLATVSCSFGLPDLNDSAWNAELATAAATGVTITSASGDQGNAPDSLTGRDDGPWPIWPATAASNDSGAVSVGGVSLSLSGTPTSSFNGTEVNLSYDPAAGTISSASAWWDTLGGPGNYAGTEGGVSSEFAEPYWQFHSAAQQAIVNATLLQGENALGRSGPDVALAGNATIAAVYANSTGTVFVVILEGTSIAAPLLAGLLADVVAVENNGTSGPWTSLGFIDPEIYRFASFFATHPGASGDPFADVTSGHNYVFTAAPGWDPLTGWGGVNAPAFLAADRNTTLLDYDYNGPTPGLPSHSSPSVPYAYIYAVFGAGLLAAVVIVLVAARASRRAPATPSFVPWGAQTGRPGPPPPPPPPGTYPGATFLCPYCGTVRASAPVRCPQCGAF